MKMYFGCWLVAVSVMSVFASNCVLAQDETAETEPAAPDASGENPLRDNAKPDAEGPEVDSADASSDDAPSAAAKETPKPSPEAAAAKAEFDAKFAAWKDAIKAIDALRIQYQIADEPTRKQLQQELQTKFEAAQALVPGVIDAALAAFKAAPKQDKDVMMFLASVGVHAFRSDQYEKALSVFGALKEGGVDLEWMNLWAGIASVALADYDAAASYLDATKKSGILDEPPQTKDEFEVTSWNIAKGYSEILDAHRDAWEKEQAIRASEAAADDLPRVLLKTSKGDITLELFENEAPIATKNFVSLVEKGFYDGLTFHRVLPNFMAQGGDPQGTGTGGPGYNIPCECFEDDARAHFTGTLSMAHGGRDTGGSQFFITFLPTIQLDGRHTAFGRVIDGMDVLEKLQRRNPKNPPPLPEPDTIVEAKVLRKRPDTDYNDFKKLPER